MAQAKKVLIVDELSSDALDVLSAAENVEVVDVHGADLEAKTAAARDVDAIIVRSGTKIDAPFLRACKRLRIVVRAGVGVDNIDVTEATRRGVVVENVPEGNTRSAAEHAIAMLLSLCRQIPQAAARLREGGWDRSTFIGKEVLGKSLGIVGLGKIGRQVHHMATSLGMKTVGFDPFISPAIAEEIGIALVPSVEELVKGVDFLTLHVPRSAETRNLVSRAVLAAARPGMLIVNCARGGVLDEAALLDALRDGTIGGAALDVFETEPPGLTELIKHPRVIATPHLGASTREAQQNVATSAARQIVEFLETGRLTSPVNTVVLDPELRERVAPYSRLAECLGQLQSQLLEGNPTKIRVRFFGDALDSEIQRHLSSAVLCGFLGERAAQPVNSVNAHHLASDMGLIVEESSEGRSRYFHQMIKVQVFAGGAVREVGGSIRGQRGLRLVSLDDYQFDAVLEGLLLLVRNEDRPGMIGVLGRALAEKNVNISYMSLGRDRSGGTAVALLNLDPPVPDSIPADLEKLEGILWARLARLP